MKEKMRRYFNELIVNPWRGLRKDRSVGLERMFHCFLIVLRLFSLQYWLIAFFGNAGDEDSRRRRRRRRHRDMAVDVAVLAQCATVELMWYFAPTPRLGAASFAAAYLLFCLYLSLFNIVFFSMLPSVNKPTTSAGRSLLLLLFNVLQVTFSFALFYRYTFQLEAAEGLFGSFLVLGTVGVPDVAAEAHTFLVPLQIVLDLLLFAFVVVVVVGQIKLNLAEQGQRSAKTNDSQGAV